MSQVGEGGTAGDEGGIDAQFRGAIIAAPLEFNKATPLAVAGPAAAGAKDGGKLIR